MTSATMESKIPANGLKRSRCNLPNLPRISGDHILQVYTHRSLQRTEGTPEERYCDNGRLSELGKSVLDMVKTLLVFNQESLLSVEEMRRQINNVFSNTDIERWAALYDMVGKLRCHPQAYPTLSKSEESVNVFSAYVAAAFIECGLKVVRKWIEEMMEYETEISSNKKARIGEQLIPTSPSSSYASRPVRRLPPHIQVKIEATEQQASSVAASPTQSSLSSHEPTTPSLSKGLAHGYTASQSSLPPTKGSLVPPPPIPVSSQSFSQPPPYRLNPLAPAQPYLPFLPLFNQAAAKRKVAVDYPANMADGKWIVTCVVNGIAKGTGLAGNKKAAKEEAAREAYYAMGWS